MKFSILVLASPSSRQASQSALLFAQSCINNGHSVYRVFFYNDGVHNASSLLTPSQDEPNFSKAWSKLSNRHNIDLVVCVAAALKRGVIDQEEAERYTKTNWNLERPYELSGLGQLLDAQLSSDRLVTFG